MIIIPAYNEEDHIVDIVSSVQEKVPAQRTIVVDDGSTDNTYKFCKDANIKVLRHYVNLGKGAALRTGSKYARSIGAEHIIFMDGDGQHSLQTIPLLLEKLGRYDLVVACRQFNGDMPTMSRVGNKFFTLFSKTLFGIDVVDTQSGFRALNTQILDKIMWKTNHYAVETEMLVEAHRNNIKVGTVETQTIYHDDMKGTDPLHGIKIALNMIYWRLTKW